MSSNVRVYWHAMRFGLFVCVPVGVAFADNIGYVSRIDGVSMQPTLNPEHIRPQKDYVFANRFSVNGYKFKRGEIVTLINPRDHKDMLIKRVVGLPGDFVRSLKEVILWIALSLLMMTQEAFVDCVDQDQTTECAVRSLIYTVHIFHSRLYLFLHLAISETNEGRQHVIPDGHCWVEGDNRHKSNDSNAFGPVPMALIQTKVKYIVWPPSRVRKLEIKEPTEFKVSNRRDPSINEIRQYYDKRKQSKL